MIFFLATENFNFYFVKFINFPYVLSVLFCVLLRKSMLFNECSMLLMYLDYFIWSPEFPFRVFRNILPLSSAVRIHKEKCFLVAILHRYNSEHPEK